jgi:hypothetical protein
MAEMQNQIRLVREHMPVEDALNTRVGSVDFVHYGMDEFVSGAGIVGAAPLNENLVSPVALELLPRGKMDDDTRQRMLRNGFVKIKTGILSADRFASADWIERVENGTVHLNVRKDQLPAG